MHRYIAAFLLGALALLVLAAPATAGRKWCAKDPVFKIDGQVIDVLVSSYEEMLTTASGPVRIVLALPVKVDVTPRSTGPVTAMSKERRSNSWVSLAIR
jgi:hypothetical protein